MEPRNFQKIPPKYLDEIRKLPVTGFGELYQWKGFWFRQSHHLAGIITADSHFKAENEDVILASPIKAGSTWLKAIIPCIMNHHIAVYDPFNENHPNSLMPMLEMGIYSQVPIPDISGMPKPRLFRTHMPCSLLPSSVNNSACKVVYIARNPKDVFVSLWYFLNTKSNFPFEVLFDKFCEGTTVCGPFLDHVLGYWKESRKRPEKVLFLKYEEMKKDPVAQVQKLSNFLGKKLQDEEVEEILEKCNLERMKSLEINKNGVDPHNGFSYRSYFRKGLVGDWKNHLTPEMAERLDHLTKMKLDGSGLDL